MEPCGKRYREDANGSTRADASRIPREFVWYVASHGPHRSCPENIGFSE